MTRTHEEKLCIQSGVSRISGALHWSFVRITFLSIFYCMECVPVAVFFSLELKEFLPSFIHVRGKPGGGGGGGLPYKMDGDARRKF